MNLFTSDNPPPLRASLFLAGGISNCPDWQADAVSMLELLPNSNLLSVVNPRFPDGLPIAAQQIEWEYISLQRVSSIIFWFPKESIGPISLFELGVFSQRKHVPMFVGTHPDYVRRFDVVHQLSLARPEVEVFDSLPDVVSSFGKSFMSSNEEHETLY